MRVVILADKIILPGTGTLLPKAVAYILMLVKRLFLMTTRMRTILLVCIVLSLLSFFFHSVSNLTTHFFTTLNSIKVGCLYATEQHPWQTDLVQAWNLKTSVTANHEIGVNYDIALVARSLGYDSIQYKNRIEFGFYHYEIVDLRALLIPFTEQRKTCPQQHVVDSALFSGWNGSNKCNCTNDSTTIVNCRDHTEYYHRRFKYKQQQKRSCPAAGTAATGGGSDPSTTCQGRRTKKIFIYDYSSVDFDRRLQSLSTLSLDSPRHVVA